MDKTERPSPSASLQAALTPLYGAAEARAIARLVFEDRYGLSQADILLGRVPSDWDPTIPARLQAGEPVQYVLGSTTFCGHRIRTDRRALIPRPETEGLVEIFLREAPDCGRVLDVCTGSGCIALACKHGAPCISVEAWDISPQALSLARDNFRLHGLEATFREVDLTRVPDTLLSPPISFILSNPPYVLEAERDGLHPNVLNHEPHLALFVPDDDPLRFYRPLAHLARKGLLSGGGIAVECNTAFTAQVARLFQSVGLCRVEEIPDCYSRPRFVLAHQP